MTIIEYLLNENSVKYIVTKLMDNIVLYQGIDNNSKVDMFSGTLYNYFVNECVMNNQYLNLSKTDYSILKNIYIDLINQLHSLDFNNIDYSGINKIVKQHRKKLVSVLEKKQELFDVIVPCAEYSVDLQKDILRLNNNKIIEPVIDIGCGQKASLVKDLRDKGLKVYGIDQYLNSEDFILCENWLEYEFCNSMWGTVIAHMSFSNHLRRCLVYNKDELRAYVDKYFEILISLKKHGSFIYCPSLPEIEDKIDKRRYDIYYFSNNENKLMDTVHVIAARI